MKWPCGDIRQIYDAQIQPDITDVFVKTDAPKEQIDKLDAAFRGLGDADEDMVAFIYDTVVGGIDGSSGRRSRRSTRTISTPPNRPGSSSRSALEDSPSTWSVLEEGSPTSS